MRTLTVRSTSHRIFNLSEASRYVSSSVIWIVGTGEDYQLLRRCGETQLVRLYGKQVTSIQMRKLCSAFGFAQAIVLTSSKPGWARNVARRLQTHFECTVIVVSAK